MIHNIAGRIILHNAAGVQRHCHLHQIGIARHAVLGIGIIDGADAVVDDIIAFLHVLDALCLQKALRGGARPIRIQPDFPDLPAIRHRAHHAARLCHGDPDGAAVEIIGGQAAGAVLGVGQFVLCNAEERRRVVLGVALWHLALPRQELWLLLADVVGEGAVVDQRGVVRKIVRCLLEAGVHRPGVKVRLDAVQPLFQLLCVLLQVFHGGIFLLADAAPCGNFGGQRHGEIAHLRDKLIHVGKVAALQRQNPQRRLRHAGLPHQLCRKAVLLGGRIGVDALIQCIFDVVHAVAQVCHGPLVVVV